MILSENRPKSLGKTVPFLISRKLKKCDFTQLGPTISQLMYCSWAMNFNGTIRSIQKVSKTPPTFIGRLFKVWLAATRTWGVLRKMSDFYLRLWKIMKFSRKKSKNNFFCTIWCLLYLICIFVSKTSFNQDFRSNFKKINLGHYLVPIAWTLA